MKLAVFAAMLVAVPGFMMGAALTGTLTLGGHGTQVVAIGLCTGSATVQCIDWDYTGGVTGGGSGTPQTATGTVDGTGDLGFFDITNNFATVNGGTSTEATVHDLNSTSEPVGTTGSPLPLASFITFNLDPWTISLTEILPGADGTPSGCPTGGLPTNGQICSPSGGPFNEQNVCTGTTAASCTVSVSMTFTGVANDGSGHLSNVIGTFSTTFSGTDFQVINGDIGSGLDVVTSDSGTLSITPMTGTPEPMTLSMMGAGLLGLGLLRRKLVKK